MNGIYAEEIARRLQMQREPVEDTLNLENNIDKGYVVVKYERTELVPVSLLNNRIQMILPELLAPMEEEMMLVKYPDPFRPDCIYSDKEGAITLTLTLEEGDMADDDVEDIRKMLASEMRRLYPASAIEEREQISKDTGWFSLDIPLLDDKCCHMMFFHRISTGLIMGTFDCSTDSKKVWKPIVRQLISTIKEWKEPGQEDLIGR